LEKIAKMDIFLIIIKIYMSNVVWVVENVNLKKYAQNANAHINYSKTDASNNMDLINTKIVTKIKVI
jgi:hypothetical protein